MAAPQTPPMSASSNRDFFDSPFSGYHTDSSRSSITKTSQAQKDLLRRLNVLAAMVQQSEPTSQLSRAMHSKLDAVEAFLSAPDPQSRLHLEDSGLFLEDDDLAKEKTTQEEQENRHLLEELPEAKEESVEDLMSFDLADRIARNVEEHMDYMNELLDEAKHREQELEEYLSEIHASKNELDQRFEEVKRNNDAALERIQALKVEVAALSGANKVMEERLVEVETINLRLGKQLDIDRIAVSNKHDTASKDPDVACPAHSPSSTASELTDSKSPIFTWSAFWNALGDAAGIRDYEELMR